MVITNIRTVSGKSYELNNLCKGAYQYEDRPYQFNYVPEQLRDQIHIKTHGDDKLISEDDKCFSFECDEAVQVFVLYPDKQPFLPKWLESYERMRMSITRIDSDSDTLKGYFGLYKKIFPKGKVTLFGCSPNKMLQQKWYVATMGFTYCMYTVCLKPVDKS